jgi:hypothetical protein
MSVEFDIRLMGTLGSGTRNRNKRRRHPHHQGSPMTSQRRWFSIALALSVLALVACEQQQAPPPPKAEAPKPPPPSVDEKTKRLAAEVYVYAYPLVLTDVTMQVQTAKTPINTLTHRRGLPDATTIDAAYPNADFLYTQGWLDLSNGPIVLSVPDTKDRYYLFALIDAWTNVAGSLGKRTTGTDKIEFAIVGPEWKGKLPGGVSEVHSPTNLAWLYGRTQVNSKADLKTAMRLQDQYKLHPLGGSSKGRKATEPTVPVDLKTDPREQIAKMDAATFFTRFALLLPDNPPAKDDAPMVEKMKTLGIVAGKPFDTSKLEPLAAKAVAEGAKSALDAIVTAAMRPGAGADIRNGWAFERDLGRWGTDYGKRALNAWKGLGANAPEDAIFMTARFDGGGHPLDGAQRYVLHFDKGKAPPTDGFWSLSLYNEQQHFAANPLERYNIGSNDKLVTNPDGSLDVYIQHQEPGKDKEANWLPAPSGPFTLVLRIYWPKQEVVDGRWTAPGIRRVT